MKRILLAILVLGSTLPVWSDSGSPVSKTTYRSAGGGFELTVDPVWSADGSEMDPRLTLRSAGGSSLWTRSSSDFEDFQFPMHACVSDDGRHVVFGGYSVHNVSWDDEYREGLRFYDNQGKLIRFISRRDLPIGRYSVSTAHWYDTERTRIVDGRLLFFTPGRDDPMEFELSTGATVVGDVVKGQGDDRRRLEGMLRRSATDPES